MRTAFHIGPYKTGTTSIQRYLLGTIGSKSPNGSAIWYPSPDRGGPGHSIMGYSAVQGRTASLRSAVEAARHAKVSQLVLSSESFSAAYPGRIANFTGILGDDVHLVITLNSPIRRAAATWQEMVKHSHPIELHSSLEHVLKRPGYRSGFITRFMEVMRPSSTSLLFVSKLDAPNVLIANICQAIGLPQPEARGDIRINARYNLIEAEMLRAINVHLAHHHSGITREDYRVLREMLFQVTQSEKWRRVCPQIPITTPPEFVPKLRSIANEMLGEVRSLMRSQAVQVYGNPEALLEADDDELNTSAGRKDSCASR